MKSWGLLRGNRLLKLVDYCLGVPMCNVLGWSMHMRDSGSGMSVSVRRILVIKLAAIGDTILLQPALRAIRSGYPSAHISWIVSPVNISVAELFAHVDEYRMLDLNHCLRRPQALLGFVRKLQEEPFDLVIDFEQWSRLTAIIALYSGAPIRVGFDSPGQARGGAYNRAHVPHPDAHEVDNFLALAHLAGVASQNRSIRIDIPDGDRLYAIHELGECGRPRIALHPGCGRVGEPRQWSPARYAEVGDHLVRDRRATVFITGGPEDENAVRQVEQCMTEHGRILCDRYSFSQYAALLAQMDLVICGNTGAMHIAAAVGTPTVAIHGPTNPLHWGPLGDRHIVLKSPLPCSPCLNLGFEYGCALHPCMKTVTTDQVIAAAQTIIEH